MVTGSSWPRTTPPRTSDALPFTDVANRRDRLAWAADDAAQIFGSRKPERATT